MSKPACGQGKETMKELQSKEMNLTMTKALLIFFFLFFFLSFFSFFREDCSNWAPTPTQPQYFYTGGNQPGVCT